MRIARPAASRGQLVWPEPTTPLMPAYRSMCRIPRPKLQMAAQPPIRTNRATPLSATGPNKPWPRAIHGSPASVTAPTSTRTRSVWLSGSAGPAVRQLSQTTHAAAAAIPAAPIQYPVLRAIPPSFATSQSPPASQVRRGPMAGTWSASARTASAQCRRSAGSNRAAPASIRLSAPASHPVTSSHRPAGGPGDAPAPGLRRALPARAAVLPPVLPMLPPARRPVSRYK